MISWRVQRDLISAGRLFGSSELAPPPRHLASETFSTQRWLPLQGSTGPRRTVAPTRFSAWESVEYKAPPPVERRAPCGPSALWELERDGAPG